MKTLFLAVTFAAVSFAADMTGYISDTRCATEHSTPIFLTADNRILKIDPGSLEKVMPHTEDRVDQRGQVVS